MNNTPTNKNVKEMNKIFPSNGKRHTVFEEKDEITINKKEIYKKDPSK